jgi:dolichol-phosphate mannosyltransferase
MGSRYLFIILYVFLEHHLSRGDYRRDAPPVPPRGTWRAGVASHQPPTRGEDEDAA